MSEISDPNERAAMLAAAERDNAWDEVELSWYEAGWNAARADRAALEAAITAFSEALKGPWRAFGEKYYTVDHKAVDALRAALAAPAERRGEANPEADGSEVQTHPFRPSTVVGDDRCAVCWYPLGQHDPERRGEGW